MKLQVIRQICGLTAEDVAKQARIHVQTLHNIESRSGRKGWRKTREAISRVFDLPPGLIFADRRTGRSK